MPSSLWDAVIQWGPPYAILGVLLWGLWKGAVWIGNRLLGEDGLLTGFFENLTAALKKLTESQETVIRVLSDQTASIQTVERRLTDIASMNLNESETAHLVEILLSELPIPLAKVSEAGAFLRTNRHLRDFLGYSGDELAGMRFQDITPHAGDLAADVDQCRRVVQGSIPSFRMEKTYRRKDNAEVYAALYVFRFPVQGNFRFFVSCIIPMGGSHGLR